MSTDGNLMIFLQGRVHSLVKKKKKIVLIIHIWGEYM